MINTIRETYLANSHITEKLEIISQNITGDLLHFYILAARLYKLGNKRVLLTYDYNHLVEPATRGFIQKVLKEFYSKYPTGLDSELEELVLGYLK